MTLTIPSLTEQATTGRRAEIALSEAQRMMMLIEAWDAMDEEEKEVEWNLQRGSIFFEVPGFEPRYCQECCADQFFDFTNDPAGECPTDRNHYTGPVPDGYHI